MAEDMAKTQIESEPDGAALSPDTFFLIAASIAHLRDDYNEPTIRLFLPLSASAVMLNRKKSAAAATGSVPPDPIGHLFYQETGDRFRRTSQPVGHTGIDNLTPSHGSHCKQIKIRLFIFC
jgi:hypothetical protein